LFFKPILCLEKFHIDVIESFFGALVDSFHCSVDDRFNVCFGCLSCRFQFLNCRDKCFFSHCLNVYSLLSSFGALLCFGNGMFNNNFNLLRTYFS